MHAHEREVGNSTRSAQLVARTASVRADRRFARIETIRAESAISYKDDLQTDVAFNQTVALARMPFIRAKATVGRDSAQDLSRQLKPHPQ